MDCDIAMLVLSAVLANHLGLIEAIEKVIRHKIPILNCAKCLSFWCVLVYCLATYHNAIASVAISFICAYLAVWLELLCGVIDTIYDRVYESIYTTKAGGPTDTESRLSELPKNENQ